jgi:hypothetical protein
MSCREEATQDRYEKWLQHINIIWVYKLIYIFKSRERRSGRSSREERKLKRTYSSKYKNKTSARIRVFIAIFGFDG